MRLLKQFGAVAVVAFAGTAAVGATSGGVALVLGVATGLLAALTYAWVVRRTEHREVSELARAGAGRTLGRGLALGIGMFSAVIAAIALFGGYRVDGWGSVSSALALLGISVASGFTEELLFRGVLFRIIETRFDTWISMAATALLFGALHLVNPDATIWGALAIAVEGGAMLAAAYVATRSLWLSIGLHIGWNFAEGGLFGTQVSGADTGTGLLHGVTSGPLALSGGTFGPEQSVFAVLATLVATVVFLRIAHRRGNIVARPRRTARTASTATV